jgi:hypothetical protein
VGNWVHNFFQFVFHVITTFSLPVSWIGRLSKVDSNLFFLSFLFKLNILFFNLFF